jgi:phosphoglycolate phosphatase
VKFSEIYERNDKPDFWDKHHEECNCGSCALNLTSWFSPYLNEDEIEESYQIFRKTYSRRICDNTCLYDGIENIINSLLEKGVKVGVVSNKVIDDLAVIMKKLLPNIEHICGGADDLPRKPSPVGTINMLEKMQVKPEYTIFVGDSKVDYDTAMNANTKSVLVTWGYGKKHEFPLCKNCVFVDNVEELEKILLKK